MKILLRLSPRHARESHTRVSPQRRHPLYPQQRKGKVNRDHTEESDYKTTVCHRVPSRPPRLSRSISNPRDTNATVARSPCTLTILRTIYTSDQTAIKTCAKAAREPVFTDFYLRSSCLFDSIKWRLPAADFKVPRSQGHRSRRPFFFFCTIPSARAQIF